MQEKNKLFVGNLSWGIRDNELKEAFAPFGEVVDAKVILERGTNKSKGFGFVTFANEEDAAKAVEAMNGKDLDGRAATVNVAQPLKPRD
jgi:RNA recognition motif-containing protein